MASEREWTLVKCCNVHHWDYGYNVCSFCSLTGAPHRLVLKLPVFITKFMESSMMSATDFFSRWKQLAG